MLQLEPYWRREVSEGSDTHTHTHTHTLSHSFCLSFGEGSWATDCIDVLVPDNMFVINNGSVSTIDSL
jgi:hypothetical protein